MSASSNDLTLILACHNEELVIEESAGQIVEALYSTTFSYETIFTDHCSRHRTRG